jgi:glycolate oxidase
MGDGGLVVRLGEISGGEHVVAGEAAVAEYLSDATGLNRPLNVRPNVVALPAAVVKPAGSEEVARIVALALDRGIALVPRGGGTGLWGGATATKGCIVVSTERMTAGPEIHRDDLYAVVGPGVITGRFRREVERRGLFYPIDPASEDSSTVGGNVAEGAAGMRGLKYGSTRNYLLGLEVVTPEAKIVNVGARTVKSVAGYDLTRLLVGSEGTLGIITSVTLKVLPRPQEQRRLAFEFPDRVRAAEAASEIVAAGFAPSALEMMEAALLVEFDGPRSLCDEEASKVKGVLEAGGGVSVGGGARVGGRGAGDETERAERVEVEKADKVEKVWQTRRGVLGDLIKGSAAVEIRTLRVPKAKLGAMVEVAGGAARKHGVRLVIFGHVGQGLIHAALVVGSPDRNALDRAVGMVSELRGDCTTLGGAVQGEIEICTGRIPAPKIATGAVGLEAMGKIKVAFDPKGIMNPGKMPYDT